MLLSTDARLLVTNSKSNHVCGSVDGALNRKNSSPSISSFPLSVIHLIAVKAIFAKSASDIIVIKDEY